MKQVISLIQNQKHLVVTNVKLPLVFLNLMVHMSLLMTEIQKNLALLR